MARKQTKFTPETRKAILDNLAQGLYPEAAAAKAGVSRSTWYNWKQRADNGDEEYAPFFDEVLGARAKLQGEILEAIKKAGSNPQQWTALAWILERTDPEHYALRQVVQVKVDKELELILDALRDGLPHETYVRCLELISARADTSKFAAAAATQTKH